MDLEMIAPMVVMLTGIVVTGGVLVLRPISKRLADLLAAMAQAKAGGSDLEAARLREVVASLESRLALLEERQNFSESLLASSARQPVLPPTSRSDA